MHLFNSHQVNDSLSFFDVLLIRDIINYVSKFYNYRKPTQSNSYINSCSNLSYCVKTGTINMFIRAFNICSSELNYIYNFFSLGYNNKMCYSVQSENFEENIILPYNNKYFIIPKN